MRVPPRFLAPVLLALLTYSALPEPPPTIKELIAQLRTELQKDMKEAREDGRGIDRQWQLSSMLLQIERAFDEDGSGYGSDFSQILGSLQTIAASEKAQQIAQALATEAGKEFAAREKTLVTELDKIIETHVSPSLKSTTAAEVDGPLAALTEAYNEHRYRSNSRSVAAAYERLQSAIEFLKRWQDYLSAKEAGRTDQMRSALSNLTNSGREYAFIPRSKLLALMNGLTPSREAEPAKAPTLADVLQNVKTLDDLLAHRAELGRVRNTSDQFTIVNALRAVADAYGQVKLGQPTGLRVTISDALSAPEVAPLYQQFLAFALPRVLLLEDSAGALKPGESTAAYLSRILADAQKKEDWALVSRVLSTSRTLNLLETISTSRDTSALTQFLAGLNQERAKQYSLAVASYQAALKTGSDVVPPEKIGEHLEKIRSEHPSDFEKGMQMTLAPAASESTDPRVRLPPMMPGRSAISYERISAGQTITGSDGRPIPAESPVLSIPAKPTPEPKPAK